MQGSRRRCWSRGRGSGCCCRGNADAAQFAANARSRCVELRAGRPCGPAGAGFSAAVPPTRRFAPGPARSTSSSMRRSGGRWTSSRRGRGTARPSSPSRSHTQHRPSRLALAASRRIAKWQDWFGDLAPPHSLSLPSALAQDHFERLVSIELSQQLADHARQRFAAHPHIQARPRGGREPGRRAPARPTGCVPRGRLRTRA